MNLPACRRPRAFRPAVRRGLTLIELVVVMVILAAVAGIILPLLPNMITRAHTTTSATNNGEIAKAIQTYEGVYLSYPNNFDSLVDTTGALPSYLPGSPSFTGGTNPDLTTIATPSAGIVSALNAAGITTMAQMQSSGSGDFSPTFFPYGNSSSVTPTPTTISTSTPLAAITGTAAVREFALPAAAVGTQFVVFGLGSRTSMQGKTMQDAPVHFSDEATSAPNRAYARNGVVFQVTDSAGTPLDKARLIGVIGFHPDAIATTNDHLAEYWNANKN